ncbi:MAG: PepSY domain-containing protein [Gemmatimonadaceae bacterium]|nr:PepSY domain-containing protein [Gemmatimonadaceae bacterium]
MRQMMVRVHRWVGLAAGLYLGMLGLSGAGVVLAPYLFALERGIPAQPAERADAAYVSPDTWLQKAEARFGRLPPIESFNAPLATPMRIGAPTMQYSTMRDGEFATGVVVVEPYTGAPLAHFIAQDGWSLVPLTLHMGFFLPYTVMWSVLVLLAWVLSGLAVSGVVAWWPRRRRVRAPRAGGVRGTAGRARHLHGALGAWTALPLVALALSGLLMSDKALARSVALRLGATRSDITAPGCSAHTVTPGQVLATARSVLPGTELGTLDVPADSIGVYRVTLRRRGSTMPVRGAGVVTISTCGTVLGVVRPERAAAGDWLLAGLVDVHSGRIAGWTGELLVFVSGVALVMLPALGLLSWGGRIRERRLRTRDRGGQPSG